MNSLKLSPSLYRSDWRLLLPRKLSINLTLLFMVTVAMAHAAYTFTALAGDALTAGSTNGTGSAARFNYPTGVAVDSAGTVYVADQYNCIIRKITSGGVVTTLAGTAGSAGATDGTGSAARFNFPIGVAVDDMGNVYVADRANHTIRKITSGGTVTTLAGAAGSTGSTNGTGSSARFLFPTGVAVDATGNVYVADRDNHTIRKITSGGVVTTLAGTAGSNNSTDGTGSAARFYFPTGVTVDGTGNVYVADQNNSTIRKITSGGVVTTLAGTAGSLGTTDATGSAARFYFPTGVTVDGAGNVYVADRENHTVRKITSGGVVTTVAGTAGVPGATNGTAGVALFSFPFAVAVDSVGNLHVADTIGQTIRWGAQTQPVHTSATTASGTAGQSFSYLVAFSGALTDYRVSGLPAGLSFNPATDLISGTPTAAGTFSVALGATNGAGPGAATLTLTILPPQGTDIEGDEMFDFNGDGMKDILCRNTISGDHAIWLMNGTTTVGSMVYGLPLAWRIASVSDFDGDGKSDILWRNEDTGGAVLWFMNGTALASSAWIYDSGSAWLPAHVADFNGDGKTDILWQNTITGDYAFWLMNGALTDEATGFSVAGGWGIHQIADFDGDGKADILWRNNASGGVVVWFMNGTGIASSPWIYDSGPTWLPAHVADFNGDGKMDILWHNSSTGDYAIWQMNGNLVTDSAAYHVGTGWSVHGVADLDGDRKADIQLRNSVTGGVVLWLMNGTTIAGSPWLYDSGLDWIPTRLGDFNGDEKADILWYNENTDDYAIWLMNGGTMISAGDFNADAGYVPFSGT